jgi:hypothetical protein
MPTPRKNQKQIAQQYAGNRRYASSWHSFRLARRVLALACVVVATIGAVIYLNRAQTSQRLEGVSTSGGISQAHSQLAKDCQVCHDPAEKLDLLKPAVASASIDTNCEKCHVQHTFHEANVAVDHSCTDCHHEHLGTGPMQPVADNNCLACHGDAAIMATSAQKGQWLPAGDFLVMPKDNLVYFQPPRPAAGYTQVFQSFEGDHPDFQIQREHLTDPNTLKFNHKIHLSGDIPLVEGKKLDCAYCHKPDSHGAYMESISFAKNCQACHSLQIDPTLADFQIPHPTGDSGANSVRDFILTLPTQYATYATEKKGLTDKAQIAAFVNQHMQVIRQRVREGADLEKEVFFADAKTVNLEGVMPAAGRERALFPGCAYCHEVTPSLTQEPVVTKPVTPDRWYVHARFDHAAHSTMSCEACHGQVLESEKTADINLPDKASCVTCHSAKGGVVSTCSTCHDYHNESPAHDVATSSALRTMMLGAH